MTEFFEQFSSQEVQFHPLTNIEKTTVDSEDLVVTWDAVGLVATVCGLKDKVEEKVAEFESIKVSSGHGGFLGKVSPKALVIPKI